MSEQQTIRAADLSRIAQSLDSISELNMAIVTRVGTIDSKVDDVSTEIERLQADLVTLFNDFHEYAKEDRMATALQLAQTQLVTVRQELDKKYGHYDVVRRLALGMLQALDDDLIGNDTVQGSSENLLATSPDYWLAPNIVTVAAWYRDDRATSERAITRGLNLDDYKSTLFYALVTRRLGRDSATAQWVSRYFQHQDPENLDREFIIILEALILGLFGVAASVMVIDELNKWLENLATANRDFVGEQRERWKNVVMTVNSPVDTSHYRILPTYSPDWDRIKTDLEDAARYNHLNGSFRQVIETQIEPSPKLEKDLDGVLMKLVTEFERAELSFKQEEQRLLLIIKHKGNVQDATEELSLLQESLSESKPFVEVLTGAALGGVEQTDSPALKKLSFALAREWIVGGVRDAIAAVRMQQNPEITVKIEEWSGKTTDGKNEKKLVQSLKSHIETKKAEARAALEGKTPFPILMVGLFVALAVLGLAWVINGLVIPGLIAIGVAGFFLWRNWKTYADKEAERLEKLAKIDAAYEEIEKSQCDILRATLAEYVNFRGELETKDADAEILVASLEAMDAKSIIGSGNTAANKRTMSGAARHFPAWDVNPPFVLTRPGRKKFLVEA